jgi:hypothetical protein
MAADEAFCREHWHGVVFEPEVMARTMREMLEETGRCRVLLNTAFVAAEAGEGRVRAIELTGGRRVAADWFIDATDGLLCLAAGCRTMSGQESRDVFSEPSAPAAPTGRVNGVTLIYRAAAREAEAIDPLPEGVPAACWWRPQFPVAQVNHYPNGDLNVNMLPTMDGHEFLALGEEPAYAECRTTGRSATPSSAAFA